MKSYQSANALAIRKKVKKAHSKAGFVGTLYLLGALAMAVFACLPILTVDSAELWVANFFTPFTTIFTDTVVWLDVIAALFYALIVLIAVINFFKCFSKLGRLSKRSSRYVNGYNRNMQAMEDMGKRFSSSFAAIIILSLLIYILKQTNAEMALTINAYITLGVGLFIHFVAGLIGGNVRWFDVHGNGGNVEEEKRECGRFVYFFRNLVQLAATVGIIYFFVPSCVLGSTLQTVLTGGNLLEGDIVKTLVPVALQALMLIFLFVLVKHATAATEFNRLGIEGSGMKNFRVFSFLTFLVAGGVFAVDYLLVQPDPIVYDFVYIAAIAFGAFLVDCIFKSKRKKEEEDYDPLAEMQDDQKAGQPMPAYPQMPVYPQMPMPQQTAGQPAPYQPIYIPVYYPYPQVMPTQQQAVENTPITVVEAKPAPAPAPVIVPAKAPENIKPTPAPEAVKAAVDKENEDPVEINKPLDPNKEWRVRCPRCGKELNVRETSPYHRCPSCDKVFAIRKFQTYVRKN